jgi:competence protein ComEA
MDVSEKLAPIFKQYYLPILLGISGVVLLLYGLIVSVLPKNTTDEVVFESASAKEQSGKGEEKQIIIDVAGAVLRPGVYKLPQDARVQDALIAAGGMSQQADREKVAKGMNLAGRLTDGGKVYIPVLGDSAALQGGAVVQGGVMGEATNTLININAASATELDTLSGVGPATAGKIIANRPYEKIEDLVSKKAVGQSVFEKNKDRISVY